MILRRIASEYPVNPIHPVCFLFGQDCFLMMGSCPILLDDVFCFWDVEFAEDI